MIFKLERNSKGSIVKVEPLNTKENKLISTDDLNLKLEDNKHIIYAEKWIRSIDHTKFISQSLKLEMFIPVDDEGNVFEKPEHYDLYLKYGSFTQHGESIVPECNEYKKALSKVLFENVMPVKYKWKNKYNYELVQYKDSIIHLKDKTIQDLIPYNLIRKK